MYLLIDLDIGIRGAVVPSWGFLASIGPSSPSKSLMCLLHGMPIMSPIVIFNGGRAAIDRANKASEGQTGWGEDVSISAVKPSSLLMV